MYKTVVHIRLLTVTWHMENGKIH